MISLGDWANMNENERISALNEVELLEANNQNREPAEIISQDMPSYKGGSYDYNTNTIKINSDFISNEEPYDALKSYYHESRHAYQHEQANNPSEANDPELAQEWKENLKPENYITPDQNPDKHYDQPVEVDARNYATSRMYEYNDSQGVSFSAQTRMTNAEQGSDPPAVSNDNSISQ